MSKSIRFIGMDVHKNSISIAVADEGRKGEIRNYGKIDNNMTALSKVIRKLISDYCELSFVYEAGPCGYELYRHLTGNGFSCEVVAPSLIPKKSGDRIKNDRRDAQMLARLHRAGELSPVYVPQLEDEAMRDLTRARIEDAKHCERKTKQRLNAFLLRHGFKYSVKANGPKLIFVGYPISRWPIRRNKSPWKNMFSPSMNVENGWSGSQSRSGNSHHHGGCLLWSKPYKPYAVFRLS